VTDDSGALDGPSYSHAQDSLYCVCLACAIKRHCEQIRHLIDEHGCFCDQVQYVPLISP